MQWLTVEEEYMNYIREYENRIPKTDYGNDKFKPFFGSLFEVDGLIYITQVSHPQTRHFTMKENKDFFKLYDQNKLIAVVNLNYMFPVHKNDLIDVNYRNIGEFRSFKNEKDKNGYIAILKKEMKQIKTREIHLRALELYNNKYKYPSDKVSLRCIDFREIENKCMEYRHKKESKSALPEVASDTNKNKQEEIKKD